MRHMGAQAIERDVVLATKGPKQGVDPGSLEVGVEGVDQDEPRHLRTMGIREDAPVGATERMADHDVRSGLARGVEHRAQVRGGLRERVSRAGVAPPAAGAVVGTRPGRRGERVVDRAPGPAVAS